MDDALRDLARGHDGLGMLLKKSNRFRESEAELRTALALRTRLSADHPEDPADRQGLADTRYHLAVLVSRLQGRRSEDETFYREALRMQEALVASSRENPAFRRKLARYLDNLGKLLASTGRLDEAEAAYREATAVVEGLVAAGPAAPGDRWLLAQCHANLAMALRAAGRLDEAEAACLKARSRGSPPGRLPRRPRLPARAGLDPQQPRPPLDGERPVARRYGLPRGSRTPAGPHCRVPQRPDYQLGLAVTRLNLAAVLERVDVREAERTYRDALAIHERLKAEFPEVLEYRLDLGRTLYSLARLRLAGNDPAGARPF